MVDKQIRGAILAIITIIPSSAYVVWQSDQNSFPQTFAETQELQVLTSFYPLYEFTKQIGQDRIEIFQLVPQGVEPHEWEPTINDLQRIQESDLIIINGIGFESWIDEILNVDSNFFLVDTSQGISLLKQDNEILSKKSTENAHISHEISSDPHIWLNPVMAKTQIKNIESALSKADPANEKYFKENAKSYLSKIDLLDTKIRKELSSCNKDFIAFHNAFSYFANEYGLTQHTILKSNDPHIEPTSKTLENLIKLAKELQINTIFTEEAVDTRSPQVIANEIGGKVLTLSPIEVVDINSSYLEKMEQNLSHLKEALCK